MKVAVAQMGARMHYAVPQELHRAGALAALYTDAYAAGGAWRLLGLVPPGLKPPALRRLDGRRAELPRRKVRAFPAFGLRYTWRLGRALDVSSATAVHLWAGDTFNRLIARRGLGGAGAVYGFNSASRRLFEFARERGLRTVLEQTIAPRRCQDELLGGERMRWPGWEDEESDENAGLFTEREAQEWALADLVLCGSRYVADRLAERGVEGARVRVVPYGVPTSAFGGPGRQASGSGPLRVLFVGAVGLRKGVPYLLRAATLLGAGNVVFRLVGPLQCRREALAAACPENVQVSGAVPRSEMARHYGWADLLCLPSLCEGSATAVYEALAAGLPVVTTPNAGSIVRDGREGFIVPIRDAAAVARSIARLEADRGLLAGMSRSARRRSAFGSVGAYGERLRAALGELEEN